MFPPFCPSFSALFPTALCCQQAVSLSGFTSSKGKLYYSLRPNRIRTFEIYLYTLSWLKSNPIGLQSLELRHPDNTVRKANVSACNQHHGLNELLLIWAQPLWKWQEDTRNGNKNTRSIKECDVTKLYKTYFAGALLSSLSSLIVHLLLLLHTLPCHQHSFTICVTL